MPAFTQIVCGPYSWVSKTMISVELPESRRCSVVALLVITQTFYVFIAYLCNARIFFPIKHN